MKNMIIMALVSCLLLLGASACGSGKADYENARFEIEQGNIENAKKLLGRIPAKSPYRQRADSLLKTLETR